MMISLNNRNYEASVWTLQDEFLTVLKWSGINNLGQIQEPKMELSDDGTEKLTFSIPMYLRVEGRKEVNPNWYTLRLGMLLEGTRKIKIIFNKGETNEEIYEFMITSVTESHKGDTLICEVTCEGACFHELGKIGYKVSLSSEAFLNEDYENWCNGINETSATIDYWNMKAKLQKWDSRFDLPDNHPNKLIPNPRIWYYEVKMDTTLYSGVRDSDKVYEDGYVTNWKLENIGGSGEQQLVSSKVEEFKEKERMVNVSESNLYNITLTIAETFNVFCRYEYGHDLNYHIIYRKVIYYNNFIKENEGTISLTYPYTADEVTRTKDSTDIISKLYVQNVSNDSSSSGLVTIMDSDINDMKEDYLFNFDYMYEVGSVTKAQYEVINKFKVQVRAINDVITIQQNALSAILALKPTVEAKIKTLENSIVECEERMIELNSYILDLTQKGDNLYTIDNPKTMWLVKDEITNTYSLDVSNIHGLKLTTIVLYTAINLTTNKAEVKDGYPVCGGNWTSETDIYGNLTLIKGITYSANVVSTSTSRVVYLTGTFNVGSYHDNISDYWAKTKNAHIAEKASEEKTYNNLVTMENILQKKLDHPFSAEEPWTGLYLLKEKILDDFLMLIGPAMREGFWNPEEYNDYGDKHLVQLESLNSSDVYFTNKTTNDEGIQDFIWDTDLFTDEFDVKYTVGLSDGTNANRNYPCISLLGGAGLHILNLLHGNWIYNTNLIDSTNASRFTTYDNSNTYSVAGGFLDNSNSTYSNGSGFYTSSDRILVVVKGKDGILDNNTTTILASPDGKFELYEIGFIFHTGIGEYSDGSNTYSDIRLNSFKIGSQATLGFLKDLDNNVIPVLILDGAKAFSSNGMGNIYNTEGLIQYSSVTPLIISSTGEVPSAYTAANYTTKNMPKVTIGVSATTIEGSGSTTTVSTVAAVPYSGNLNFITSSTPTVLSNGLLGTSTLALADYENAWLNGRQYKLVYPRIRIDSLNVKHNSTDLKIKLVRVGNNSAVLYLKEYEDYSFLIKAENASGIVDNSNININQLTEALINSMLSSNNSLAELVESMKSYTYITFKPEIFYKYNMINFEGNSWNFDNILIVISYNISNAGTCIYIDAKEVLLENALPKATYTVNPSKLTNNIIKTPSTWLDRIVSVNDAELHFLDVKGYISRMELDLDHPELDKIEIKNYKSKFEDLFSSIIALTESMKKREYALDVISSAFTGAGTLTATVLENSINGVDLDLAFSLGTLTISDKEGIWGTSKAGVVAFTGGGIFTANLKTSDGNWRWNTGILPSGINASLITSGLIDTSKIVIMSGKNKYFLWNTEGIIAYKFPVITGRTNVPTLYVIYNGDGLALIAPRGSYYYKLNDAEPLYIGNDIKRVEIGWDGFTLRDYGGERTLWMDASTGNLSTKGSILATSFLLIGPQATNEFNTAIYDSATILSSVDITERVYIMTNSTALPAKPTARITATYTDQFNTWALSFPAYPTSGVYYYYSCLLSINHNGDISWTDPLRDGATAAMISANLLRVDVSPITAYGMIGYNASYANLTVNGISYDAYGYPIQLGRSYGLILGNSTDYPLLIGSNGGIHIVNRLTNSTAVVINSSGIAISTGSTFSVDSANFKVNPNGDPYFLVGNTSGNYLSLNSSGTLAIKGTIYADSLFIGNTGIADYVNTAITSKGYLTLAEVDAMGFATTSYVTSLGFYTEESVQQYLNNGGYTTLGSIPNLIWAEVGDNSSHSGWALTTSGMVISTTGAFVISAGLCLIDQYGNATFSGALNAASGSFAGSITATSAEFSGPARVTNLLRVYGNESSTASLRLSPEWGGNGYTEIRLYAIKDGTKMHLRILGYVDGSLAVNVDGNNYITLATWEWKEGE